MAFYVVTLADERPHYIQTFDRALGTRGRSWVRIELESKGYYPLRYETKASAKRGMLSMLKTQWVIYSNDLNACTPTVENTYIVTGLSSVDIIEAKEARERKRPLEWCKSDEGFTSTKCGRFEIVPMHNGCCQPQWYDLKSQNTLLGGFDTQKEAKKLAQKLADETDQVK